MPNKEMIIPLSRVLSHPDKGGVNKAYIDIILNEEIPIICVNKGAHKKRLMPFKVLHDNKENFWQQGGSWDYYLSQENIDKIKEKASVKPGDWDMDRSLLLKKNENVEELQSAGDEAAEDDGFGNGYKEFAVMSTDQRIDYLNDCKKRLNELGQQKPKNEVAITEALVDTTRDAAIINHATIEEAIRLGDNEAKKPQKSDCPDRGGQCRPCNAEPCAGPRAAGGGLGCPLHRFARRH